MAQTTGKQHRVLPCIVVEAGELGGSSTSGGRGRDGRWRALAAVDSVVVVGGRTTAGLFLRGEIDCFL